MKDLRFLSNLGNPDDYSPGLQCLTTGKRLFQALDRREMELEDLSNAKTLIREKRTGKWFRQVGSMDNLAPTMMLGAICGDTAGSVYEHHNTKKVLTEPQLLHPDGRLTDDSVMTLAVADGIRLALEKLGENWMEREDANEIITAELVRSMRHFGRRYPLAGYGGSFQKWLRAENPEPYNSWGNGSAMRASYPGWCANSLEEAERLAELSAAITHNHPEGIKGAKVVAGIIYLLRSGKSKTDIRRYASQYYDLNFTLNKIRLFYRFDVSCQGSVPQAIEAFLEGNDFAEVIALAISIGGDSDTIAAIAGSMAEVIYPISGEMRDYVIQRMDPFCQMVYRDAVDYAWRYEKN